MNQRAPAGATATPTADDIHAQHARIVAWLRQFGRVSCPDLATVLDVPSVTKRVCELIASGWPITRTRGLVRTKRCAMRRTTFYELTGQHPQGDLFGAAAA